MRIGKTRPLAMFIASTLTATTIGVALPGKAFADDSTTTTSEVSAALDKADAKDNTLVATAMPSTTDSDSAAQTATVGIPADPTTGVKFTAKDGKVLTIGLPNAKQSGKGQKTHKGVVAYSGRDGSANAVVPTVGGVQFLTTIENRRAPSHYTYPVNVPDGGSIELVGRGAIVYDAERNPVALVAAPWAKDANGQGVSTYFTVDGTALTQHVRHKVRGVAYPVVADPWWLPFMAGLVGGNMINQFVDGAIGCGNIITWTPCRAR